MIVPSAVTSTGSASPDVAEWQPDSVGLPRAAALATAMVAALIGGVAYLVGLGDVPPPRPPVVTVQLMDAASALSEPAIAAAVPTPIAAPESPAPLETALSPEPMPEMAPEPASAPLPLVEPVEPQLAVPSPIVMPTPPPVLAVPTAPVSLRPRPVRRAVRAPAAPSAPSGEVTAPPNLERAVPSAPAALLRSVAPASAPADVSSGLGPYGAGLHRQIERNILADRRVTQLGVSGTAVIEATIAPDGRVVSARLARSSGTRGIDEAALGAVQRGGFPPFGPHMPAGPITMNVPIGVEAE